MPVTQLLTQVNIIDKHQLPFKLYNHYPEMEKKHTHTHAHKHTHKHTRAHTHIMFICYLLQIPFAAFLHTVVRPEFSFQSNLRDFGGSIDYFINATEFNIAHDLVDQPSTFCRY